MPVIHANGIDLAYEWHGTGEEVLVLIQGLGMPLTAWPPGFIDMLTGHGFRVLVFDNRDIGQSQKIDAKVPSIAIQYLRYRLRLRVKAPYQLTDMMRDTEALMNALGIDTAHVLGISMGGMIAQLLAVHAPTRVKSLVLIMTTTGNRRLPGPTRVVSRHMRSRPASDSPEDRLAFNKKTWQLIGSPAYPPSEERIEETLQRIFDRGVTLEGFGRQLVAVIAAPSRVELLRNVIAPTLVIHGDSDPLVPDAGGRDTAATIPGARLEIIPGMGHDLPMELFEPIASMITGHVFHHWANGKVGANGDERHGHAGKVV